MPHFSAVVVFIGLFVFSIYIYIFWKIVLLIYRPSFELYGQMRRNNARTDEIWLDQIRQTKEKKLHLFILLPISSSQFCVWLVAWATNIQAPFRNNPSTTAFHSGVFAIVRVYYVCVLYCRKCMWDQFILAFLFIT